MLESDGRVDELSAVLRLRRRAAAAAHRRRARDDLSLRPVRGRRRQDGDAGPAERARVGSCSATGCCSSPRSRPTRASHPTRCATSRARRAARHHRRGLLEPHGRADRRAARGRADRQRARQRHGARSGSTRSCTARERWTEVDTPAGAVPALLPPALPASFEPRMDPVPALGEHTDAHPAPSSATTRRRSRHCAPTARCDADQR